INQTPETLFTQTLGLSTLDTVKAGAKHIRHLEETALQTIGFCLPIEWRSNEVFDEGTLYTG
ncbi:hypothetical protein FOZ61_006186, partial [Perkinsus olseni]